MNEPIHGHNHIYRDKKYKTKAGHIVTCNVSTAETRDRSGAAKTSDGKTVIYQTEAQTMMSGEIRHPQVHLYFEGNPEDYEILEEM